MRKYFLIGCLLLCSMGSSYLYAEVEIGSRALDFSLPKVGSSKESITMGSYKQESILLNFWASWCKGCKKEMPFLHKLAKDNEKKLSVIAVNIDNKETKAQNYIDKFTSKMGETSKIKFVYDKEKSLPKAYKFEAVPCSLLIKNGTIIKYYVGSFDDESEQVVLKDIKEALK